MQSSDNRLHSGLTPWVRLRCAVLLILLASVLAPNAAADLIGTVPTLPSETVFPGLVPPGTNPGTLLASLTDPFVSSLSTESGTIVSAVFMEAGGTLDFYYQISNNLTAPKCGAVGQPVCDPLVLAANTNFLGFTTATGFRTDGATLSGGVFVNGTVAPVTADRNAGGGVVDFSFLPPDSAKIQPGQTSTVLVISTDATNFTAGNVSVIGGGVATVASFEPFGAVIPTPEPSSLLLLGTGLLSALGVLRRKLLN
jgi:hypothetical protein